MLELFHQGVLVFGQGAGMHFVNAQLVGDRFRRGFAVAGEHHQPQAGLVQDRHRIAGIRLDRVGHGHEARQRAVDGDPHHRFAAATAFVGLGGQGGGVDVVVRHQRGIADLDCTVVDTPGHAPAGDRFKIAGLLERQFAFVGGRADRARQRMLAGALQTRSQAQQVGLVEAVRGFDGDHTRRALGERAGLVHEQHVHVLHALERFGIAYEHAFTRAASDADHYRHGCGKTQRTGAGDDEHGNGRDQRMRESRRRAEQRPRREGDDGGEHHGRHEHAGHLVGHALNRRA